MKTATFIERSRKDQRIAVTLKKRIPWNPVFNDLKVGDVFEGTFSVKPDVAINFRVVQIIKEDDSFGFASNVTFWVENVVA